MRNLDNLLLFFTSFLVGCTDTITPTTQEIVSGETDTGLKNEVNPLLTDPSYCDVSKSNTDSQCFLVEVLPSSGFLCPSCESLAQRNGREYWERESIVALNSTDLLKYVLMVYEWRRQCKNFPYETKDCYTSIIGPTKPEKVGFSAKCISNTCTKVDLWGK